MKLRTDLYFEWTDHIFNNIEIYDHGIFKYKFESLTNKYKKQNNIKSLYLNSKEFLIAYKKACFQQDLKELLK